MIRNFIDFQRKVITNNGLRSYLLKSISLINTFKDIFPSKLTKTNLNVTKIHGLLRTGTNYLSAVVQNNFQTLVCRPKECGWKHGPLHYNPCFNYIILVKDPYSWFISFKKWEQIHNRTTSCSIADFILSPISHKTFYSVWRAENPIDAWNKAMGSWIAFKNRNNVYFLRYEDIINDFYETMIRIENFFHYSRCSQNLTNIKKRVDTWRTPNPRDSLRLDYYLNEEYLLEYTETDFRTIRNKIDDETVYSLGYRVY